MSTTETADSPAETQAPARLNLGVRLKAAREARGMSEQDVAQRLRLDLHIIRALEADDLERLPAMTFVRGYLRNYARLVGLDERMVTEALPDTAVATAKITLKRSASSRRPMSGPRFPLGRWLRNIILLAVLGFLILNAYPWVMRMWEARQSSGSAEEMPGTRLQLPGQESPPEEAAMLADGETRLSLPAAEETVPEPALEELLAPEPVPETQGTVISAPEPEPLPVVAAPAAALVLTFDEDSWVEVEDHDRRLLYGMMHKGEQKRLEGHAPFRILLGNAPGVKVEYAGERVDIRSHTSGKVARFTLP